MHILSICLFLSAVTACQAAVLKHLYDLQGDLNKPSDVAASSKGYIYVMDGQNHCVKSFDTNGKFRSIIGRKGSADGQFLYPLGLDIGASGKIYIADSGNHRIQILDHNGLFLGKVDLPTRNGRQADPTDLVADESGHSCYIVDNDNHRILHYDLQTLRLKKIYGEPGTKKSEFHYPFTIAQTRTHDLCIVDVLNTRVQVLSSEGLFVTFIGEWGVEKGHLYRPKGVAVDKNDRVFVSDSYMGVVQIFDATGKFLELTIDPITHKTKKFNTPVGLCFDSEQRLYVVEMTENRVGVYQLQKEAKQ